MTDKEFDNAIKTALTSDEVPSSLNRALFKKTQKKNSRAKIYTFTKFASVVAAVFICAVMVLSFYNSDNGEGMKSDLMKNGEQKEAALPDEAPENKAKPHLADSADSEQISPDASARIANDVSKPSQTAEEKAIAENASEEGRVFAFGRKAQTLPGLFNEGYDYKSVIDEKIREQIKSFSNSSEYDFSGISENVRFALNDENTLTIIFDAGEIVSATHGEQYFTVGTVANGVLN